MSEARVSRTRWHELLTVPNYVVLGLAVLSGIAAWTLTQDSVLALSVTGCVLLARILFALPELAIWIVIASSALALIVVQLDGDKAFLSTGSFVAAGIGALGALFRPRTKRATRILTWMIVITVILIAVGLIVGHGAIPLAQAFAGARLLITPLLCAVIALSMHASGARRLLRVATVLTALSFGFAVAEHLLGAKRLVELGLEYGTAVRNIDGVLRAPGLFTSNYSMGSFAGIVGALALVWWPAMEHGLRPNIWRAVAVTSAVGCLILSTYRTGLLVFLISLVLLGFASLHKGAMWKSVVLWTGTVLVAVGAYIAGLASVSSLLQRLDIWSAALDKYGFHPLGHGVGFAGAASGSRFAEAPVIVDNYYLNLYLQFGLLAVLFFVPLFAVALFAVWHARKHPAFGAGFILLACLVGFYLVDFWEYTAAMSLAVVAITLPFGLPRAELAGLEGRPSGRADSVSDRGRIVAIWRSTWLPPSETFIRNQATSLTRWTAKPLGTRTRASAISSEHDAILYGNGRLDDFARRLFELTGRSTRIRRYLKREGVDLIHAQFGNEGILIAGEARRAEIPLVITVHGSEVTEAPRSKGLRGLRYRRRLSSALRSAETVIAVSDFIRSKAIECGAPPERTIVHHIGIPLEGFSREQSTRTGLLFVGRLVEKKGVLDLLRAMAILPAEFRDVPLIIVGDGPLKDMLKEKARGYGLNVEFVGSRTPVEVRALMQRTLMYAAPSKQARSGDTEGLPTVVMEAGAAGAAVVGYVHAGIPDVVINGETGILVTEGDYASLAKAITRLLRAPDEAVRLGEAARERVTLNFDIKKQAESLEDIYDGAQSVGSRDEEVSAAGDESHEARIGRVSDRLIAGPTAR